MYDPLCLRIRHCPSVPHYPFFFLTRVQGVINGTPAAAIRWIPGSENLFLTAHMDGSLVVYDKEREDAYFTPEGEEGDENGAQAAGTTNGVVRKNCIHITKSVRSQNQKTNPVAAWKLSNHRANAFAFSPDNRHLAVASEDGTLKVIDYLKEECAETTFPLEFFPSC